MKFSIVIPVYNVEEYVEECVDSILNQTCHDYEVILVDDGSSDRSGELCDSCAERYPNHVNVIHQQNRGQMAARISGLEKASGEIILFVDSDDMLREDALALIGEAFEKTECDMLLFQASRDSEFHSEFHNLPYEDGQYFEGVSKQAVYALMIETRKLNPLWMKAVKKSIFNNACQSGAQGCRIVYGEDLLMSLPLVTHAKKISYLAQKLYYYRPRQGSVVSTFNPNRHRSIKAVHQEMEKYIGLWEMQEYHGQHYAREVDGWIETLKLLLKNQSQMEMELFMQLMQELSKDDYFRKAYCAMPPGVLTKSDALLAKWLYEGKFGCLKATGRIAGISKKLRGK